jgi:hypothetical protein
MLDIVDLVNKSDVVKSSLKSITANRATVKSSVTALEKQIDNVKSIGAKAESLHWKTIETYLKGIGGFLGGGDALLAKLKQYAKFL